MPGEQDRATQLRAEIALRQGFIDEQERRIAEAAAELGGLTASDQVEVSAETFGFTQTEEAPLALAAPFPGLPTSRREALVSPQTESVASALSARILPILSSYKQGLLAEAAARIPTDDAGFLKSRVRHATWSETVDRMQQDYMADYTRPRRAARLQRFSVVQRAAGNDGWPTFETEVGFDGEENISSVAATFRDPRINHSTPDSLCAGLGTRERQFQTDYYNFVGARLLGQGYQPWNLARVEFRVAGDPSQWQVRFNSSLRFYGDIAGSEAAALKQNSMVHVYDTAEATPQFVCKKSKFMDECEQHVSAPVTIEQFSRRLIAFLSTIPRKDAAYIGRRALR